MPFVSMIMVRSRSQTTERFYLCSANDFVSLLPSDVCFFDVCLHLKKVPPPKIPIRQPVNYLRERFSMTTEYQ